MYTVTITAKTPEELDEKVRAYVGSKKIFVAKVDESTSSEDESEMEEVPSPFSSTPVATTAEVGGAVDSEGLPWDKRIHSSSKEFNKDGSWRIRRNLDKDLLAQVRAELLSKRVVTTPVVPTPTLAPTAPVVETTVVTPAPVQTLPSPAMPVMQSGHSLETFRANFPMVMSQLITEGKVTQEYVQQLCEYFKVQQIWQASAEQQQMVFENFAQAGIIKKVA